MAVIRALFGHGYKTLREIAGAVNSLLSVTRALGNPGLAIDTNFDVQNGNAIDYQIAGAFYTLAANTTADTGTTASLVADTWGVFLVTADDQGDLTATWKTNDGAGYASEAAAIAALTEADIPDDECVIGYVTVKTGAGTAWDAGTDALQGGTGGDPSADTNYYNDSNPNGIAFPAIVFPDGTPS